MLRRPVWLRVVLAVWSIWLQAEILDPGGIDACPVHGHHAAHVHDMGAMHRHMPAEQHGQHGTACTCLGACCCSAPVATTANAIELPTARIVEVSAAPHCATRDHAPRPAHSLPFANGPPRAALPTA